MVKKILAVRVHRLVLRFSYFALFTYVFTLFLEVSHGAAALTHLLKDHSSSYLILS